MLPVPPRPESDGTPPTSTPPASSRLWSYVLVFFLGLTSPLWCCLCCNVVESPLRPISYLIHGRWPADSGSTLKIEKGMTEDEVIAVAGQPHKREPKWDGAYDWYYYHDSYGLDFTGVSFDKQGRVRSAWIP